MYCTRRKQCAGEETNVRVESGVELVQNGHFPNPPSEGNTILSNTNYKVCTLKRKGPKNFKNMICI